MNVARSKTSTINIYILAIFNVHHHIYIQNNIKIYVCWKRYVLTIYTTMHCINERIFCVYSANMWYKTIFSDRVTPNPTCLIYICAVILPYVYTNDMSWTLLIAKVTHRTMVACTLSHDGVKLHLVLSRYARWKTPLPSVIASPAEKEGFVS